MEVEEREFEGSLAQRKQALAIALNICVRCLGLMPVERNGRGLHGTPIERAGQAGFAAHDTGEGRVSIWDRLHGSQGLKSDTPRRAGAGWTLRLFPTLRSAATVSVGSLLL